MTEDSVEEVAPDVAEDFWLWPPLEAALMGRHMGRVSKLYRQNPLHEKAITQETLARWLGRTQGAVSRLERAKEAPRDLTV